MIKCSSSAYEINDDKMEYNVGKEEICKCPLRRDVKKLTAILWIGLDTETY